MRKLLLAILLSGMLLTACKKDKDNNTNNKNTIEYFNANLKAEMKYDEMVNLLGQPDGDTGSGIQVFVYFSRVETERYSPKEVGYYVWFVT